MVYRVPRLIDLNAASKLIRGKDKLLVIGRCVEVEHPWALEEFKDYAIVSVCLEEEHVNQVGFKLVGMISRCEFKEVAVLTVDGSMHCVQLHFMVEEAFKIAGLSIERKHYVIEKDEIKEVPVEAVKTARYLSKVAKLMERCR